MAEYRTDILRSSLMLAEIQDIVFLQFYNTVV